MLNKKEGFISNRACWKYDPTSDSWAEFTRLQFDHSRQQGKPNNFITKKNPEP